MSKRPRAELCSLLTLALQEKQSRDRIVPALGAGINIKYFTARVGIFVWRAGGGEINVLQRDTAPHGPDIATNCRGNVEEYQ